MIAIVLAGTLLMPRMLRRPTIGIIVAVGACAAAAALARMAGIAFTGTVVVAALLWLERPMRQRRARRRTAGRDRVDAARALDPRHPLHLRRGRRPAVAPALPARRRVRDLRRHRRRVVGGVRRRAHHLRGAAPRDRGGARDAGLVRRHRAAPAGATDVVRDERVESNRLLGVLALFVVAYVVVLYLTATLFDAGISVEGRFAGADPGHGCSAGRGARVPRRGTRGRHRDRGRRVAIVVVVLSAWPWRQIAQGFGTTSTVDLLDRGFQPPGRSALGERGRRAAGRCGRGVDLPVDALLGEWPRRRVRAAALGPDVGGAQRRVPLAAGGARVASWPSGRVTSRCTRPPARGVRRPTRSSAASCSSRRSAASPTARSTG